VILTPSASEAAQRALRGHGSTPTCRVCEHPRTNRVRKLRPWRAFLMRARAQELGVVYAPDEKAAEAAAIAEFKIADEQRRRLIVREQE